ncbi:MAG TPA: glycoside hydrolase family 2 TIM barrel-domain containing protein [Chitinophagaceae bacterium]|nr:glycoside hydrolase family 2 TIM barrel-domain containing protein [Chitinophagaceae bacterium]
MSVNQPAPRVGRLFCPLSQRLSLVILVWLLVSRPGPAICQSPRTDMPPSSPLLQNPEERTGRNLDGKWEILPDPFDAGTGWKPFYKDQQPVGKSDFYEYRFTDALTLNVPGDWNSQDPTLLYYEGTVWYKRTFTCHPRPDHRLFLYFGGANYQTEVYCNGQPAGSHEGGFTPFQAEVTNLVREGSNTVIVRVNNRRRADGIPAMNFDWWNYGGITRDVYLLETPRSYVADYFLQLPKGGGPWLDGWVQLAGDDITLPVTVSIPELRIRYAGRPDQTGRVRVHIPARPERWSPGHPKRYQVLFSNGADSIADEIGFRTIETKGHEILLNGKPVFLKGVNIHEQIPQRAGRAWSESDARQLLGWARDLGCNFVRLTHYPHNEHMIRLADQMGILLWEEIPLWQGIAFSDPAILQKADTMLGEMILRDKNRAAIILWSLSNETTPGPDRNRTLAGMARYARSLDSTRLITSAFNHVRYRDSSVTIDDPLGADLDVLAVNEYLGWYSPWPAAPQAMTWKSVYDKPLIMSEFGAEALYGHHGSPDTASSWSEEYQERLYRDQVAMFRNIPFLRGTTPWVLADFRSPSRLHPVYQQGWNRKGLLGSNGLRKKAWYIMQAYYASLPDIP